MRKLVAILAILFFTASCRTRISKNGLLSEQPAPNQLPRSFIIFSENQPDLELTQSQRSERDLREYKWYANLATAEESSLYERFDKGEICERQFSSLVHVLHLEIKRPRLVVSDKSPSWATYQQTRDSFLKLVNKYNFEFETYTLEEATNSKASNSSSLYGSDSRNLGALKFEDLQIDRFETALIGISGKKMIDGYRKEIKSNCPLQLSHLAQLINLHLRFPRVLVGKHKEFPDFNDRHKNLVMLLENLKIER